MSIQTIDLSAGTSALLGGVPEATRSRARHEGAYVRLAKPTFDRLVAAVLLVLLLWVIALVAIAVRIRLGKGVLYRQRRVGRNGEIFTVLKFRTMLPDRRTRLEPVAVDVRSTHKSPNDPRHTRLGRTLRRWSLDELPQLFNILRGDMSLVGPRPELVDVVDRYDLWDHPRHLVRPGLTGIWQTTARSDGPTHAFTHLDEEYVRRLSLLADLRILIATGPAALGSQKGT